MDARVFPEGHYRKGVFLEAGFATRQGWMTAISQEVDRGSDNWESERAVCRAGVLLKRIPDGAFGQGTRWRIEWRAADSRLDFDFIFPEAVLVLDGYGEINRRCNTGPMHSVIRTNEMKMEAPEEG